MWRSLEPAGCAVCYIQEYPAGKWGAQASAVREHIAVRSVGQVVLVL